MHVIFDCDGVLIDSEPLANRVEAEMLTRWGWSISAEQARAQFKGKPFAHIAQEIQRRIPTGLPADWIYDWAMQTACAFERELQEIPGVRALIERLRAANVPIAVASQSSLGRVRLSLAVCELDRYFGAHVYVASMVARPKPAPDVYLFAAAGLGAQPADCIVIEDSPSGVAAARAAGMTVYGFAAVEPAEGLAREGAVIFHDMHELPKLLGV